VATAATVALAGTPAVAAAPGGSTVEAAAPAADPAQQNRSTTDYAWIYNRQSDVTNGQLSLVGPGFTLVNQWRAGSGQPGYDECVKFYGPLPYGGYSTKGHDYNYPGSVITGAVIRLSDRDCYNGTPRDELFIHSSYPWSTARYQSEGCIKVSSTSGPNPSQGQIRQVVDSHVFVGEPAQLAVS
jgi:hypothetical protein